MILDLQSFLTEPANPSLIVGSVLITAVHGRMAENNRL